MSISYENFNEVSSFDVIFIGHLASITANMFAMKTKNMYKSLVLSKQSNLPNRNIVINSITFTITNMYRRNKNT